MRNVTNIDSNHTTTIMHMSNSKCLVFHTNKITAIHILHYSRLAYTHGISYLKISWFFWEMCSCSSLASSPVTSTRKKHALTAILVPSLQLDY